MKNSCHKNGNKNSSKKWKIVWIKVISIQIVSVKN